MGSMDMDMFGADATLTLNANNDLVKYLVEHKEGEYSDTFAKQLYDLAMLSNKPLSPSEMTAFVKRSNEIMMLLAKQFINDKTSKYLNLGIIDNKVNIFK